MKKVINILDTVLKNVLIFLMVVLVAAVSWQVISRYGFASFMDRGSGPVPVDLDRCVGCRLGFPQRCAPGTGCVAKETDRYARADPQVVYRAGHRDFFALGTDHRGWQPGRADLGA